MARGHYLAMRKKRILAVIAKKLEELETIGKMLVG